MLTDYGLRLQRHLVAGLGAARRRSATVSQARLSDEGKQAAEGCGWFVTAMSRTLRGWWTCWACGPVGLGPDGGQGQSLKLCVVSSDVPQLVPPGGFGPELGVVAMSGWMVFTLL